MALVDKQIVDAKVLEHKLLVGLYKVEFFQFFLQIFPALLQAFNLLLTQLRLVVGAIQILYKIVELVYLVFDKRALDMVAVVECAVLLMAQYDTVVVVYGYLGEELLSVGCREVFLVGCEDS